MLHSVRRPRLFAPLALPFLCGVLLVAPRAAQATDPFPPDESGAFQQQCSSDFGQCTIDSLVDDSPTPNVDFGSRLGVACSCNTGAGWSYEQGTENFQPLGSAEIGHVCQQELALCNTPNQGGQGQAYNLAWHERYFTNTACAIATGQCHVSSNAQGRARIICQCSEDEEPIVNTVRVGLEPNSAAALVECFREVSVCAGQPAPETPKDTPDSGQDSEDIWDCSVQAQGLQPSALALLLGLFVLARRKKPVRRG